MVDPAAQTTALLETPALARLRALVDEMRVPVTPVKLQLDLLLGADLAPEHRRSVEMLSRNCARLVVLLDELERHVARLEEPAAG